MDWMAKIKAALPFELVLSGEAPQERRKETVSSAASRAAPISGVNPFFVGCKDMMIMMVDTFPDIIETVRTVLKLSGSIKTV